MIEKIAVVNSNGDRLEMPLRYPEVSGYAITSIEGIEPVQVDIKTSQLASGTAYRYNAGFHKIRLIKINTIFDPSNDLLLGIEELRNRLGYFFPPNDIVTLYFYTDTVVKAIRGVVSTYQPTYFSQQCGASIEVTCPEIWFYEKDINYRVPFDMSYRTRTIDGVQYGEFSTKIMYRGSFQNGFQFALNALYTSLSPQIHGDMILSSAHSDNDYKLHLHISTNGLVGTNKLVVSTEKDRLEVYSGNINKIAWVDANDMAYRSAFPILKTGLNEISFLMPYIPELDVSQEEKIVGTIAHSIIYGGV